MVVWAQNRKPFFSYWHGGRTTDTTRGALCLQHMPWHCFTRQTGLPLTLNSSSIPSKKLFLGVLPPHPTNQARQGPYSVLPVGHSSLCQSLLQHFPCQEKAIWLCSELPQSIESSPRAGIGWLTAGPPCLAPSGQIMSPQGKKKRCS